jgi:aspartyl-tRNA(Asn)/glutamyl-tRNA(Gln) amidotransferase subunit C
MRLSADEVRKIARLARLRLSPEEEETFVGQLGQIIDYFDLLSQYPSAEPEHRRVSETLEVSDTERPSMPHEDFLDNAPKVRGPFLLVPQVKVIRGE